MDGLFSLVFCSFRGFTVNVRGFVLIFLFKGKCMEIFVCLPEQSYWIWLLVNALLFVNVCDFLVFCSFRGTVNALGFVLMLLFYSKYCMGVFCGFFCVPIRANLLDLVSQFYFWFH